MNITYAQFFQPVEVPQANGTTTLAKWVSFDKGHKITLQGQYLKVQPKNGGVSVYVTIFNTSFFRTDHEDTDPSAETSRKNTPKAPSKQAPLV